MRCIGVSFLCLALPEAEALEIYAPAGVAAHMDDGLITQVRGGRGGGGMHRGGVGIAAAAECIAAAAACIAAEAITAEADAIGAALMAGRATTSIGM